VKNLLLILLLANILFFLWGMLDQPKPQPGVVILDEREFGPPPGAGASEAADEVASIGATPGSGTATDREAVTGRSCVSVGPFMDEDESAPAERFYADAGLQTNVRSLEAEVFVGHWVQIREVSGEDAARNMLAELKDGGLKDAYIVRTEDEGLKISLGVFDDIERAERVELEARSMGYTADISPRRAERTVRYVDIELPPGTGARSIVERYGEGRVLLGDAATCP
jgi:hypothetical protein